MDDLLKKCFFLSLMICFSFSDGALFAQAGSSVLEGTVVSEDQTTLPGVSIFLPQLSRGTTTDTNGRFRIAGLPEGNYTVQISMVGYQSVSMTVQLIQNESHEIDITLITGIFYSDALVVTATRRSQLIGRVSVSMNTITPEELNFKNVLSLENAIEYLPGVQVLGNSVNIRGSSGFTYGAGSRVLLLVDGVPLMGPDQGGLDFDGLPFTQTQQIEVLKSPGSALYGGGALGGVINIITKNFSETPENTIRIFGGVYEPVRYSVWRENWDQASDYRIHRGLLFGRSHQVNQRFGYWLSGKLQQDEGYLRNNELSNVELYAKTGWNLTDQIDFSLYSGIRRNRSQQFLYWNGLNDPLNPGEISLGGETAAGANEGLSDRLTILPVFIHQVSETFRYSLKGRLFGVAFRPIDSEGNVRPSDKHNVGVRYGGEAQFDLDLSENFLITSGLTFDENYVRSDIFVGEDGLTVRNQPEGAVFTQFEYLWNNRLTTTAGVRYDVYQIHTQSSASQLSPKLSASYQFTDHATLRASYGRGFRVPSVAERFFSNRDFFPLESNITLKPETSTGLEAGMTYMRPLADNFFMKTDLTGFWNNYEDLVEPTFVPEIGAFQFVNLVSAQIRGFETSMSLSTIDNQYELAASYTYLDTIDKVTNEALTYRSSHLMKVSGRSALTSWADIGVDFRSVSAPKQVDSDFSLFVPDAELFPKIVVTDIRLRLKSDRPEQKIRVSGTILINNLFDYYYVSRPAFFAPPRNGQLILNVAF